MNKILQKAIEYNAHGYSIMPLRLNKRPSLPSWIDLQKDPATEEQIILWWKKNPKANIGILTGKISSLTVIDIDVDATIGTVATPLAAFPETYTVQTPSGGYQLYYQYDSTIQQTANTFPQFPHVDIRNDGGYVVAPPSYCDYMKHKKRIAGTYTIIKNLPLSPFPSALFPHNNMQKQGQKASVSALLKSFPRLAEGDGRNNALTSVMGKIALLVPHNEYESIAYPMILSANARFKNPLEEKEVRIIFESITKKEQRKPLASIEFIKSDKGVIIVNAENIYRTLINDPQTIGMFRFNSFAGTIETKFSREQWEPFQKVDVVRVAMHLSRTYRHFSSVKNGDVEDAILRIFEENRVSPPLEWLKSLVWDAIPRLDDWLATVYGTPADAYHRAVGSNWLKGLVNRLVNPGSKFDYVLVLEGVQGMKKSMSLAALGGAWHVETVFTPDNKDFFMIFAGKAIVEFSEGETLSRTEAKRLKAVITMQNDKYRPPYERSAKEFPRQCVFAMTTNQEQYLKDETGNRRWLPVACQKEADIDWLSRNREQLFAEAYHRVITLKETTWEFPEEETKREQLARQTVDPREEQIYDWYYYTLSDMERDEGITTRMAFVQGVYAGVATVYHEMGKLEEMVIGSILRESMHLDRRRSRADGARFYRYYPSDKSKALAPKKEERNYQESFGKF